MYSVGQPVAYLFAMGVGLATLVDANSAGAFGGVSYLAFIAPALLISAAVMTAANEFTFPVMDGFKWRRVYYGPHASPLTPEQIAGGQVIAVTVPLPAAVGHLLRRRGAVRGLASGWGWVSILVATLAGPVLRPAAHGLRGLHQGGQGPVRHGDAVHRDAAVPVLRHLLPAGHASAGVRWIGWISPIWHGTELGRVVSYGYEEAPWLTIVHVVFLLGLGGCGLGPDQAPVRQRRMGR